MKLAFSSLGCTEIPLDNLANFAAEQGFGAVELRGIEGEHVHPGLTRVEREKVRRNFSEAGVEIICVTAYTKFATNDPDILSEQIETLETYAALASDLGSPRIRTFMGGGKKDGEAREYYSAATGALLKAADVCGRYGVKLLLETHDTVSSTKEIMSLLKLADHENLRILWDIPHSLREGESLKEGWSRVRNKTEYVHLKDEYSSPEGDLIHCLPGEGQVPLAECRKLLDSDGFKGWYCLEWERKWHPEMPPIEQALKAFKAIMF